jgi:membrane protease YdiL (CAAX protease family)
MAEDPDATTEENGSPAGPPDTLPLRPPQAAVPPWVNVPPPGWAPWGPPHPGGWGPPPVAPWGPPPAGAWTPPPPAPGPWAPGPWWPTPVLTPAPDQLEPRLRHPRIERSVFSLAGRAAPRLYAAGWILTVTGLAILGALIAAATAGIELNLPSFVGVAIVEATLLALAAGLVSAAGAQTLQRRADGWADYFGASPFLLTAALILILSALPMRTVLSRLGIDIESAGGSLLGLLVYLVGYVAMVHFLVVRTGALSWHDVVRPSKLALGRDDVELGPRGPVTEEDRLNATPATVRVLKDVGWAVLLLVPVILATVVLLAVLMSVLGLTERDIAPSSPVPTANSFLDRLYALIAVAIVAPIGEEIFFRGFATNAWARSLKRHRAILQAGLFFAAIHVVNVNLGNGGTALRVAVVAFGGRIPVSIALAWLYVRRRSIVASGSLHSAYNGTLVILSWIAASSVP